MDSDTEFIDNSIIADNQNHHTVFIAETDDDESSDTGKEEVSEDESFGKTHKPKLFLRTSNIAESHVISSSDEDINRKVSVLGLDSSPHRVVLSSSDEEEEEASPELVPRRRPPLRQISNSSNNSSIIGRKNKKRMIIDSDTENSIIIEHNKNTKMTCLQDTPIKIAVEENSLLRKSFKNLNTSVTGDNNSGADDSKIDDDENRFETSRIPNKDVESSESDKSDEHGSDEENASDDETNASEGPDEDAMVFSKATRMSIMGMIPDDGASDDSDFIQSDESKQKSRTSSRMSNISDLPEAGLSTTVPTLPLANQSAEGNLSRISCSPFSSPNTTKIIENEEVNSENDNIVLVDDNRQSVGSRIASIEKTKEERHFVYDDDVTIIDSKPEVIALSSDDEEETTVTVKKSPRRSIKEDSASKKGNGIKQYMLPESYPNQVKYVKRQVRENELQKLERLKADLHGVQNLLEHMDINTLPDKGAKFVQRLATLKEQIRVQGDLVSNMVVEPDNPTLQQMKNDGFDRIDRGLTWDDLAKASNAVQPKWSGKQGMATHMAERNLILDRLNDLHKSLASRPPETKLASTPRAIKSEMMPHQKHAIEWLVWRETQKPPAGILADDMGLGKTITMIALIATDKERAPVDESDDDDDIKGKGRLARGGTLVVCPASLIQQWAAEVQKHCKPHQISVMLHHGANRATQPMRLASSDIVVTTYNILQRDNEKTGVLMRILWTRIILDEAHIVRNHKSATSMAVCNLKGRRRWCLTGTPVQNKDLDLFALLKFLRVSPFDDLTMWKKWIDNKSIGGQDRLNTITASILLRRTKVQLQQKGQLNCLPERTAHVLDVTLSKEEMNVYQKVLVFSKTLFAQFLHQRAEKEADGQMVISTDQDTAYAKMHKRMLGLQGAKPVKSHEILVLLLRLRQVCCHCGLIAAMLEHDDVTEEPATTDLMHELNKLSLEPSNKDDEDPPETGPDEGTSVAEAIRSVLSFNNPVFNLKRQSSKIKAVMECLKDNVISKKGEKAVVVSQWTSVLRLVEDELKRLNVKTVTLSGQVPVNQRHELVNKINDPNNDTKIMLLSLCAGGVGLNLCGASHLLLLDPHWNPQLEAQAQDRVYRVGQTRHVHLYRFVCVDTVEQTIRKLQEAKLELAENVLTGARNTNASKLTIEDLKMLFNMGPTGAN